MAEVVLCNVESARCSQAIRLADRTPVENRWKRKDFNAVCAEGVGWVCAFVRVVLWWLFVKNCNAVDAVYAEWVSRVCAFNRVVYRRNNTLVFTYSASIAYSALQSWIRSPFQPA